MCKGEVERLISAPAIQFKGAGWYVTDYAGKGGGSRHAPSSTESSGNGKADASENKPAAKTESSGAASSASTSSKSE